jgi:hypothetical protein
MSLYAEFQANLPRLAFAGETHQWRSCVKLIGSLNWSDSQYYVTDPDVKHVPVEELLSKVCANIPKLVEVFLMTSMLPGAEIPVHAREAF